MEFDITISEVEGQLADLIALLRCDGDNPLNVCGGLGGDFLKNDKRVLFFDGSAVHEERVSLSCEIFLVKGEDVVGKANQFFKFRGELDI